VVATIVSVAPNSGSVGSSTTIAGSGFKAGEVVTVTIGGTSAPITSGGTAGADGSLTVTVTVPAVSSGAMDVRVSGTGYYTTLIGGFTVTPKIVSVSPSSGTVGSSTTITGSGFKASEAITVKLGTTPAPISSGPTTTDSNGTLSATVNIPALGKGTYDTVVTTATDPTGATLPGGLTVIPKVTSAAVTKNVGDSTTITVTGFKASEAITVKFSTTTATITAGLNTDASGNVSATVDIPALAKDTYDTVVTTTDDATGATLTNGLTVTPSIILTPNSGAVGDNTTVDAGDLPPKVVPTTELELPAFWLQVPVADNQVSYVA